MKLIDGKELARSLRGEIAAGVAALKSEKGITPGLAVILVGDNPASVSYVTAKEKACTEAGMLSRFSCLEQPAESRRVNTSKISAILFIRFQTPARIPPA